MLQQTQTSRVVDKYKQFIEALPDFHALASAPLQQVLALWQGLGYNRRAKALREIGVRVVDEFAGSLPDDPGQLETFPMIGWATARSITAFAFNKPVVFIETNIRHLFLFLLYRQHSTSTTRVHDNEILPLVEKTLYRDEPRLWYNALMDYGLYIKRHFPGLNKTSSTYSSQAAFKNSNRQIRGKIIRLLSETGSTTQSRLTSTLAFPQERIAHAVAQLAEEGFVTIADGTITLTS
jgi:A/G-specific adenine glycosylase